MSQVFIVTENIDLVTVHPTTACALAFIRDRLKELTGNDYIGDISRWKYEKNVLKRKGYKYRISEGSSYLSPASIPASAPAPASAPSPAPISAPAPKTVIDQPRILKAINSYYLYHCEHPTPLQEVSTCHLQLGIVCDDIIPWDLEFCKQYKNDLVMIGIIARLIGINSIDELVSKFRQTNQ